MPAGPHTPTARLAAGRYRLVGYLAKGGMAEVWEGYDEVLSRPVAIKMLLPHLASDQTVLERFRREAVTAASLAHPGVIATYDTGVDGQTAWIVMELVRGRTLRHLMSERGPLDPTLAVRIAGQVTDALAHAHRHGLVHRDVKPANILLCDDEGPVPRAKVTDFGIAKATEGLGLDLTKTGIVLGTPKYLSPEQVEGLEPDPRADLYSLGVVLFEMLAGKPPFSGPTDMATALSHLRDEPPRVSDIRPDLPAEIDRVVAGLLVKDREQRRPASAPALRRELATIARHPGGPTTGTRTNGSVISGPVGHRGGTGTWGQAAPTAPGVAWGPPAPTPTTASPTMGRPPSDTQVVSPTEVSPPPPIAPPPPEAAPPAPSRAPVPARSGRGVGAVVGALLVAGVVIIGLLLSNGGGGSGSAGADPDSHPALAVSGVTELIPAGHTPDHESDLGLLADGDPTTTWSTDVYPTAAFGGLYSGLGLVVHLSGGSHTLHDLVVSSPSSGWKAQAYVSASEPAPSAGVGGWGSPTATMTGRAGTTTFDLGGRKGEWVMLWLTRLSPASGADSPYLLKLGELAVS